MTQPNTARTALDAATREGLAYAARLVDRFGWMPPSPDCHHLDLGTTLNLAACETAPVHRQTVYDVTAVMAYRLSRHVGCDLIAWQDTEGLDAGQVAKALRAAVLLEAAASPAV